MVRTLHENRQIVQKRKKECENGVGDFNQKSKKTGNAYYVLGFSGGTLALIAAFLGSNEFSSLVVATVTLVVSIMGFATTFFDLSKRSAKYHQKSIESDRLAQKYLQLIGDIDANVISTADSENKIEAYEKEYMAIFGPDPIE